MTAYPKRLIEVDLPISCISACAAGKVDPARTHLRRCASGGAAASLGRMPQAVIWASLWPDPADPICPQSFRDAASQWITDFAEKVFKSASLRDTVSPWSFEGAGTRVRFFPGDVLFRCTLRRISVCFSRGKP